MERVDPDQMVSFPPPVDIKTPSVENSPLAAYPSRWLIADVAVTIASESGGGSEVDQSAKKSEDIQSVGVKYCDRCARRASTLLCDDRSLQQLCQDCSDHLARLRGIRPKLR